jgi:hypothetical protein
MNRASAYSEADPVQVKRSHLYGAERNRPAPEAEKVASVSLRFAKTMQIESG